MSLLEIVWPCGHSLFVLEYSINLQIRGKTARLKHFIQVLPYRDTFISFFFMRFHIFCSLIFPVFAQVKVAQYGRRCNDQTPCDAGFECQFGKAKSAEFGRCVNPLVDVGGACGFAGTPKWCKDGLECITIPGPTVKPGVCTRKPDADATRCRQEEGRRPCRVGLVCVNGMCVEKGDKGNNIDDKNNGEDKDGNNDEKKDENKDGNNDGNNDEKKDENKDENKDGNDDGNSDGNHDGNNDENKDENNDEKNDDGDDGDNNDGDDGNNHGDGDNGDEEKGDDGDDGDNNDGDDGDNNDGDDGNNHDGGDNGDEERGDDGDNNDHDNGDNEDEREREERERQERERDNGNEFHNGDLGDENRNDWNNNDGTENHNVINDHNQDHIVRYENFRGRFLNRKRMQAKEQLEWPRLRRFYSGRGNRGLPIRVIGDDNDN